METACNYTDKTMYVSTDERWLINRLLKFKETHSDEMHIIKYPEDNDGCFYLSVPAKWLKITPSQKRELSEEQRIIAAQRLLAARKNKSK